MAGAIKPVLKGVYVCDDVVANPAGGKPMVVNLWNAVRVPAGGTFPYTLKKLCVFAWLRGGRGRVTFRIDLIRTATGARVGHARVSEYDFTDPNASVYGRFLLEDVVFPAAGRYPVEFFCDGEFFDDQPIQVYGPQG
ncbi:MAG: hypothetical protein C0501_09030 [Isosphaera sp.]|nr:hypothetical protein [Isosphaera sp.]